VPDQRGGHQPDWSGAGDQHIFAEHREGQRRMHRIAKRVEDGSHVQVDAGRVLPHVARRQHQVLGERTGPGQPDAIGVRAQMSPAGTAVAACATDDVPFAAH
jgi:hypothetical protein